MTSSIDESGGVVSEIILSQSDLRAQIFAKFVHFYYIMLADIGAMLDLGQ